ncbi:hypothetical protein OCU04_010455 [Sclerotinia nivalis]|uniref:PKS/mFAS DH domain-containing protein n=1 Tax=Sclerotinia nivalis TaxID=352851 RepID=A0A9X0DFW9_9HELO|nr:hypothetical protein OCU04_010455 [Sclerotinia nivalis]
MMSVGLDRYQILPFLDEIKAEYDNFDLSVACYNSPANITVSGNVSQVVRLKALLDERNIFARKLQVQVAYHSSHMYEIADRYLDLIGELEAGDASDLQSSIMVSSVFGRKMEKQELLESKYWVENLTSPVKFLEALNFALHISAEDGSSDPFVNDLIEIGPHSALRGPIKDILQHFKMSDRVKYYSMLTRYGSGLNTALKTVGELKCDGYDINLATVNYPRGKISSRQKVLTDLPEYPFDHSKIYWTENRLSRCFRFRKHARLDLLGTPSPDSTPFEKKWRHTLKIQEMPWIDDHKVNLNILYYASS